MRGNQGNTMEIKDPVRGFVAVLLLLSCLSTGGVEAAGQMTVESFVARQTFDDPRIQSGGSYVVVSAQLGEDYHGIIVFSLADLFKTAFINLTKYEMPIAMHWVRANGMGHGHHGPGGTRAKPSDI